MGSTGHHVARMLAEKGIRVRAMVHREDDRSEKLRQSGIEVVQGDLLEYRSVRSAMEGVYRAYFSYPVQDGLLEATTNFAVAAKQFRVELLVNLSQYLRGDGDHPHPIRKGIGFLSRYSTWPILAPSILTPQCSLKISAH